MNQLWGSMEQYEQIAWGWPIALYLFLAGLSAGAAISAIVLKHMGEDRHKRYDGIVKAGSILAPLAIAIGLLLLIADLTRPLNFWRLLIHYNMSSVMSIGVLALFIYFPLTILFLIGIFGKQSDTFKGVSSFASSKIVDILTLIFAVIVGAYTGFLLSAMNSHPLLNTPALPVLFLASGASAGICASLIAGMLFFGGEVNKNNVLYLHGIDKKIIFIELFLLFTLFVGMIYQGGDTAQTAVSALSGGFLSNLFWFGVVLTGLILPIVLNILFSPVERGSLYGFIFINAAIVLIGVVILRFYILYAGQTL
jgi:polysulfide reductase chain C